MTEETTSDAAEPLPDVEPPEKQVYPVYDYKRHVEPSEIDLGGGLKASASFAKLAAALSRAQANFGRLEAKREADVKNKSGQRLYTYNYANLADTLEAALPALTAQQLAVVQSPTTEGGRTVCVSTVLIHSSGEYMRSSMSLTAPDSSPQTVGKAVTYCRRYSLLSLIGLAPAKHEDTDAEPNHDRGASAPPRGDELDAEVAEIETLIGAVENEDQGKALFARINKLPNEDKMAAAKKLTERLAALRKEG